MGNRGLIILQGKYRTIKLYTHWGGDPESMTPFLEKIKKSVLNDPKKFNSIDKIARFMILQSNTIKPQGRISSDIPYIYFVFYLPGENVNFAITIKKVDYYKTGGE
jgi:hypothetical protein